MKLKEKRNYNVDSQRVGKNFSAGSTMVQEKVHLIKPNWPKLSADLIITHTYKEPHMWKLQDSAQAALLLLTCCTCQLWKKKVIEWDPCTSHSGKAVADLKNRTSPLGQKGLMPVCRVGYWIMYPLKRGCGSKVRGPPLLSPNQQTNCGWPKNRWDPVLLMGSVFFLGPKVLLLLSLNLTDPVHFT